MRTLKWVILITCIVFGGIAIGTATYIYTEVTQFDKVFAPGIWVEDLSLSGLTQEEAKKELEDYCLNKQKGKQLILYKGQVEVAIPFEQLGLTYDSEQVLEKAYAIGHHGNLLERYRYSRGMPSKEHHFELVQGYNQEKVAEALRSTKESFHLEPIDATITRKNRAFITTSEVPGEELDLDATLERTTKVLENLAEDTLRVEVVTKEIPAHFTKASFAPIQQAIASFYTSYNNSDLNRNINLKVAAEKINICLQPNETFSLAKQLEPITYAAGYRNSSVIVNGKLEQGIGGGVCQIASTLYNALLLTNVDISMRQNHSLPVAYVPLGRDATYSSGAIDFQFKNNSELPLFIESYCENNKVYVNVYASPTLKPTHTIKFTSETTQVIQAPEPQKVDDPELEEGKEVEDLKALNGKRVNLYRLAYDENNQLVSKELVNSSYYRPRGAVIKVGTKKVTEPTFNEQTQPATPTPSPDEAPDEASPIIDFTLPTEESPAPTLPTDDSFLNPQS